eukprot:35193-Rhodomonas_salina.1
MLRVHPSTKTECELCFQLCTGAERNRSHLELRLGSAPVRRKTEEKCESRRLLLSPDDIVRDFTCTRAQRRSTSSSMSNGVRTWLLVTTLALCRHASVEREDWGRRCDDVIRGDVPFPGGTSQSLFSKSIVKVTKRITFYTKKLAGKVALKVDGFAVWCHQAFDKWQSPRQQRRRMATTQTMSRGVPSTSAHMICQVGQRCLGLVGLVDVGCDCAELSCAGSRAFDANPDRRSMFCPFSSSVISLITTISASLVAAYAVVSCMKPWNLKRLVPFCSQPPRTSKLLQVAGVSSRGEQHFFLCARCAVIGTDIVYGAASMWKATAKVATDVGAGGVFSGNLPYACHTHGMWGADAGHVAGRSGAADDEDARAAVRGELAAGGGDPRGGHRDGAHPGDAHQVYAARDAAPGHGRGELQVLRASSQSRRRLHPLRHHQRQGCARDGHQRQGGRRALSLSLSVSISVSGCISVSGYVS